MKKRHVPPLFRLLTVFAFVAALAAQPLLSSPAQAAQITNRSLTMQAGPTAGADGGALAGGTVNHLFEFDVVGGSVGSIVFEYCTTAAAVSGGIDCDTPVGLDTTGVTLGTETGATGFSSINVATNGTVIISRTAASATAGSLAYRLDNVVNPSDVNQTFFVRISLHTSLDGTDLVPVDSGTVTGSTAEPIILDGTMPESLVFCTGETIGLTGGVPDCSTATDGVISFNQLFSPTDTATASSQMAASTNAGSGYAITVNGPTLTSGSNTIAGMATQGGIVHGTAQFGLNLKENTTLTSTTPVGLEVAPIANSTNYRGQAAAGYEVADSFKFVPGEVVANSYAGGAGGTDAQIYTVSYIANVPGSQPAGTYTTTLTYICTPTF